MKILFTTEYFYPYIHGGGEISTQELAKSLCDKGEIIHVLTPNYGAVSFETLKEIKIHRFWFFKKLKNFSDQLSPSWYFNPAYFLILFTQIAREVLVKKTQIIHVQGLFSLPSAIIAGKMLKVPVVVTFRDAQILCNYGACLSRNQFGRACNLKDYFFADFMAYWHDKVLNKNISSFVVQLFFAFIGRIRTGILRWFAGQANELVVSSFSQQKTFAVNGFKVRVIHNIFSFPKKCPESSFTEKTLLYATKMSFGKGLDLLLEAFRRVLAEYPDLNLLVIGSGDKKRYENLSRSLNIDKRVKFFGRKFPAEVMKIRQKILIEVVPSIYPESFGRTALESLASGIPVIASNRGGLIDIIEDGKTGYVVNPTVNELAGAIIQGINNNQKLRKNISERYLALKNKFEIKPLGDHLKLYKSLLK